jgi:hypothetical protein
MRSRVRRPALCCPVDLLQFDSAKTAQSQQPDNMNQVARYGAGPFVARPTPQKVRQIRLTFPQKRSSLMPETRWSLFHEAFNHLCLTLEMRLSSEFL